MNTTHHEAFEANRRLWNAKTAIHLKSDFYNHKEFLAGKTSLRHIELAELPDVQGKSILHLQCHFGQDSLSLARRGAKVTGVDFSESALAEARRSNDILGLDADFIQANIYDLPSILKKQYDIVFTSYGVLAWLPDLVPWAKMIADYLKPQGTFYIFEFHPALYTLDWEPSLNIAYSYFNTSEPYYEKTTQSYTKNATHEVYNEYFWTHSLSEIITPLLQNGLRLQVFKEYPYSPYDCFPHTEKIAEESYRLKGLHLGFPHLFYLKASKDS